jgi:hypothetical protein
MVVGRDIEWNRSDRNLIRAQRLVQICYAGSIAQRLHNPRSVQHYHSQADCEHAIYVLSHLIYETNELEACLRWLLIRTQNMFSDSNVWRGVQRLAEALVQRGTICGKDATEIILAGFDEGMNAIYAARGRKSP